MQTGYNETLLPEYFLKLYLIKPKIIKIHSQIHRIAKMLVSDQAGG